MRQAFQEILSIACSPTVISIHKIFDYWVFASPTDTESKGR